MNYMDEKKLPLVDFKDTVKLLSSPGLNVDFAKKDNSSDENTLLHRLILANKKGQNDTLIKDLLIVNLDLILIKNGKNRTALCSLIYQWVDKGCDANDFKNSVDFLYADLKQMNLTDPETTLFHFLALHNEAGVYNSEIHRLLISNPKLMNSKNDSGQTVIAAIMHDMDVFPAKFEEDYKKTVMLLAEYKDIDLFVKDTLGNTFLHRLVLNNPEEKNKEAIKRLSVLNRQLFNGSDHNGNIPLQLLLLKKSDTSKAEIEELLTLGSNLNTTNVNGDGLLHTACAVGNLAGVKYLVEEGLLIQSMNWSEQTVLHKAVNHQNKALWQWLWDKAAVTDKSGKTSNSFDTYDMNQQTVLHLAARQNNTQMVEWLSSVTNHLQLGFINASSKDLNGETALDIAVEHKNHRISFLLLQAGLLASIGKMKDYGESLKGKKVAKGQMVSDHAQALQSKAEGFFQQKDAQANWPEFQKEFTMLLNSKNNEMSAYRAEWSTIIKNVLIALTGIGLLFIAGQLIYSKATEGRALFFFQKNQTSSERTVADVSDSVDLLGCLHRGSARA